MTDINIGQLSEAINNKTDRDGGNIQNGFVDSVFTNDETSQRIPPPVVFCQELPAQVVEGTLYFVYEE